MEKSKYSNNLNAALQSPYKIIYRGINIANGSQLYQILKEEKKIIPFSANKCEEFVQNFRYFNPQNFAKHKQLEKLGNTGGMPMFSYRFNDDWRGIVVVDEKNGVVKVIRIDKHKKAYKGI